MGLFVRTREATAESDRLACLVTGTEHAARVVAALAARRHETITAFQQNFRSLYRQRRPSAETSDE